MSQGGGIICDVGYADADVFIKKALCQVCGKRGIVRYEYGWVGLRGYHLSKKCLGQWEIDGDGRYLTYVTKFTVDMLPWLRGNIGVI